MMKRILSGVLLLCVLGLTGCGSQMPAPTPTPAATPSATPTNTPEGGDDGDNTERPETGDTANLTLYVALVAVCVAVLAGFGIYAKRRAAK